MLNFISKHSSALLASCVFVGFAFPTMANLLLPLLPIVLFTLMVFTLVSLDIKQLTKDLTSVSVWSYAVWHSVGCTLLVLGIITTISPPPETVLAVAAATATGSLFASPAIVRSLGLDPQECMAMTIATTLLMPWVLLLNAWLLSQLYASSITLSIDFSDYFLRLVVFILLPIFLSLLCKSVVRPSRLELVVAHTKPITIVLVFFFPLGLMGAFRESFGKDLVTAMQYLGLAFLACGVIFATSYILYMRAGKEKSTIAAITATNRNVLLTYSVTGGFLGGAFDIYMGALQLPVYLLPLFVRAFYKQANSKPSTQ